jgi:hypothetical protein
LLRSPPSLSSLPLPIEVVSFSTHRSISNNKLAHVLTGIIISVLSPRPDSGRRYFKFPAKTYLHSRIFSLISLFDLLVPAV